MIAADGLLPALVIILALPYLVWRIGKTECYVPLFVLQIVVGILVGPGALGSAYPEYYLRVFSPSVLNALNGIAWWAAALFVCVVGMELDLKSAWKKRRESCITAALALSTPLMLGSLVALALAQHEGWIGYNATAWQFVLGVGMACSVTALPVLMLFLDKLGILRESIGQRLLRYASIDDIAIWVILALILMDWQRIGRQLAFLLYFAVIGWRMRKILALLDADRCAHVCLIWLTLCALGAEWTGFHFLAGAFLAGAVIGRGWLSPKQMDDLRQHLLLIFMPAYFFGTGLRTNFTSGAHGIFAVAGALLLASVVGKLLGAHLAGKILKWEPWEYPLIGWLLQTKGLIEIVFANILLDKHIITSRTFTALLFMAVASTLLTVPVVAPMLKRKKTAIADAA